MPIFLTRRYKLSAVHRHFNPDLSAEENKNLYQKCFHTHGHEYLISVTVKSEIDSESGLLISRDQMDHVVKEKILQPFSGSFLNDHVGNTSGEVIADRFFSILHPAFHSIGKSNSAKLVRLSVQETKKNSFSRAEQGLSGESA